MFGSLIAWLGLRSRGAALSARLSLMEKELAAGKADLERLQRAHIELVAGKARVESALEAERKTSNEKIELVTRASEELRNAFKAMASDALKSNNSSFLVIAEETLKRFQSQAQGDLEARQKAVADMVLPVRESLSKVDAQIQQMEVARGDAYGELRAQVEAAIDFADEQIDVLSDTALGARLEAATTQLAALRAASRQGRLLTEGMTVVIAGRPNAGKSSLLNRLAGIEIELNLFRVKADGLSPRVVMALL